MDAVTERLLVIPTGTSPDYASFWRRLVAAGIDAVVIRIFSGMAGVALGVLIPGDTPLVDLLYAVGFIAHGATPGMHILGVRVIDREGNQPWWRRSAIRAVIPAFGLAPWYLILVWPNLLSQMQVSVWIVLTVLSAALVVLDPLWMIWDEEKQALHDKLASTWVIRVQG